MEFKSDIQIAQECQMAPIAEIAENAGIDEKYLEQYGKYKAKIHYDLLKESERENGKLILVDYKTDGFFGVPEAEAEATLRARHSRQIGYYKYACEKMFGVPCEHAYIYSFALNKTIDI